MSRLSRSRRALAVITRWLWGTALVTWRYLWETTPLHRSESVGDEWDRPPQIPPDAIDDRVQLISDGCGPLFHRRFHVRIAAAEIDADQLIDRVIHDFKHFVPTEVVDIRADEVGTQGLEVGDEMLVEMPGPWNGPVKVVHREDTLFTAAVRQRGAAQHVGSVLHGRGRDLPWPAGGRCARVDPSDRAAE